MRVIRVSTPVRSHPEARWRKNDELFELFFDKRTSSQHTWHIKCNESSEGTEHCWLLRVVPDEVTQLQSICSLNVISIVWIAGVMAIDLVWQTIKTCFNWERHHTVILSPVSWFPASNNTKTQLSELMGHGSSYPQVKMFNYSRPSQPEDLQWCRSNRISQFIHTQLHNTTISNTNSFRFQYQCESWCCCCEDCPDK